MQNKIIHVKLTSLHKVEIGYNELFSDGQSDEIPKRKCSRFAHQDLVDAYTNLRIHLATRAEQGEYTEFEDHPEKLDIFEVDQITIGGTDEHEGVTLSGFRKLKENNKLPLNPPFIKFSTSHSNYAYCESLHELIFTLLSEADQYLKGKSGPDSQMSLSFEANEETSEEEVKPKKARKSKAREALEADLPTGVTFSVE